MISTNTIVVYNLPKDSIDNIANDITHLEIAGLERITAVKFLRRLILVFDSILHAEQAMHRLQSTLSSMRNCGSAHVGYSIDNNISTEGQGSLNLPDAGTLLFISPPPSPPAEWVEFEEEEPNTNTHFEEELSEKLRVAFEQQQKQEYQKKVEDRKDSPVALETPVSACSLSPNTITIMEASHDTPALHLTHE